MNIQFLSKERLFKIDTIHCSYVMAIADKEGFLGHVYYGPGIHDDDISYFLNRPYGNHHVIIYGNYKKEIIEYMSKLQK